jgi:rubrerythrin
VKGFVERKSLWLARPLGLEKVRAQAELMEAESKRFYQRAARQSTDAATRQLLGDLANPAPVDASRGPVDNDVEQYGLRSG